MAVDPNLLQGEFNDGSEDCAPEVEQLLAGFLQALIDEYTSEQSEGHIARQPL